MSKTRNDAQTSWVRIAVLLFIGVIAIFLLYQLGDVLKLFVISALLAYLLDPFATWLESYGTSRTVATLAIFALLILLILVLSFSLFPIAVQQLNMLQTDRMVAQAMVAIESLESKLTSVAAFLGIEHIDLISTIQNQLVNTLNTSFSFVPGVVSMLGNLVIIPFMLFFFIKDAHAIKKGFIDIVPNRFFEFSLNVLQKMDLQLGNYLRGQFLVAFFVGSLSTLALWLLGVDFFLVIGPLAGLANMIPYVGPAAGAALAILASVVTTGGFDTVPGIVVAFATIQLLDNSLLSPIVLSRNVELHPMVILLAILVGGKLFGIVGLLLAVPFTAIAKVVVFETLTNLRRYHI